MLLLLYFARRNHMKLSGLVLATRRALLAVSAAAAVATLSVGSAFAAAPLVKTSAPAYFRMMLGDFEVTVLSDGTVDLPSEKILTNTTPAKVGAALAAHYLASPVETSVNAYLINTGSKLVLIDTGAAGLFGPTLGKLLANLKAAGYTPEQVDEIYITHFHGDHVGGLMSGEKRTFPNAVLRASKHESDYWLNSANLEQARGEARGGFLAAQASVSAYVKADKFLPFDGSVELVPGVKSYVTHGHTPGHSNYVVESKGQKLMLIGDLIHVGSVQFADPSVTVTFDKDSKAAGAERQRVFAQAAKEGYFLGAAHIQFPGIGHLRASGKGYEWIPVNHIEMR
jgi:glyoxylase-like metal-dependent hydrolase (beta-lactamase superfamily II)